MAAYSVTRFDAIDEIDDGGAPYRPLRHQFGIASFCISSFTGRKAGDRIINEHSEEDDQEELYLVFRAARRSSSTASESTRRRGRSFSPSPA